MTAILSMVEGWRGYTEAGLPALLYSHHYEPVIRQRLRRIVAATLRHPDPADGEGGDTRNHTSTD
ncbi:hypothetical protein CCYS_01440 [Corynebacterium cystitidis DSM 20524]|uniref:Uncharacterized protein n=1 Tax=Corynebacterium cystitidis DSM 20524 TaxID=1121357 RepID=A0A1H9UAY9_9CORY|nr:hypothetical protein CCYS_01440 [Corynebacterium cystitidis DSM 20524]SES06418.1 hypothetical protein SAMN05661109_01758 [Corynebacterium cystitidis DSM 20524]SNV88835.1 Uncharacterised protein [Corynebacterium cystitidis]